MADSGFRKQIFKLSVFRNLSNELRFYCMYLNYHISFLNSYFSIAIASLLRRIPDTSSISKG